MIKHRETKLSPKNFASKIIERDLDIITEYWAERWEDIKEDMTQTEINAVQKQLDIYASRIFKILKRTNK